MYYIYVLILTLTDEGLNHEQKGFDCFFQLDPVIAHRIKLKLKCDSEEALEAFIETAGFLHLCKDSDFLVPSIQIDDVWHELILCTREYQKFCEKFMGTFIHHSPELPNEEGETNKYSQGYQRTLFLVCQNGKLNPKFWRTNSATEAKCGGAGCSSDNPQLAEAKCGGAGCSSDNPQLAEAKCGGAGCGSDGQQLLVA